jgi:hypothetical protein
MTQERLSGFVFSIVLIAVTAYWVWFLFSPRRSNLQALTLRKSECYLSWLPRPSLALLAAASRAGFASTDGDAPARSKKTAFSLIAK